MRTSVVRAIAISTYRELIRSKILYAVLFAMVALVLVSTFFGTVTIGDQVKVIKDFGLFAISLMALAFTVISGSAMLYKELERKTIYNILGKAVERSEFIAGKYFGMLATVGLLVFLSSVALSAYMFFFEGTVDVLIFEASFFIFLQLAILCAVAMFFSSIVVTPVLSGLFTLGVFLAGRSAEYLLYFIKEGSLKGLGAIFLKTLYWTLPPLDYLNISNRAVFGESISLTQFWGALGITLGWSLLFLSLATLFFRRRQFN